MKDYTLTHTGTTGSARFLFIEFCGHEIDPEDYPQLAEILDGENMTAYANHVRDAIEH